MMKSIYLFLSLLLSPPLWAEETWIINPDHSEIHFEVDYLTLSSVSGRFKKFKGEIQFDQLKRPTRLKIAIKANSIDTGNRIRDNHLKGRDFFLASKYSQITFQSENILKKSQQHFIAKGSLTIKKVKRPLTISFKLSQAAEDLWGKKSQFANYRFKINREDYQLDWNKSLKGNKTLVGKVVNIYGSFQLQARSKKTNSSAHMVPDNNYMKMKNEVKIGKMAPEQFQEKLDSFDKETRETVNTLKEKKVGSLKSSDSFASPPPAKNTIAWFMLSFGWISFFALIGCLFSVQSLKSWILEKVPGPKLKDILIGGTYLFFIITYALALGHSLGKLY